MKKIKSILYIIPVIALVSLASCKKFLDVQPKNNVSDEVTIVDKASAETAVRGVYNAFTLSGYYGNDFQMIGYLGGDNTAFFGTVVYQSHFGQHNVRADNGTIQTAWGAIYKGIDRANHVIAKVPNVTDPKLTAALKNQYLGEAYFLRALAYFDLVRVWGGVQIFTTPNIEDKQGVPRSDTTAVFAQVLSDLIQAEALIPSSLATNRVRATQKTVWALRARYHLYRGEWADAEFYSSKLISDVATYSLVAPYNSWFANGVTNTRESIFELAYATTSLSAHRGNWQPTQNGGTRSWGPNAAFIALVTNPATGGTRNTLIATTTTTPIVTYGNLYYRNPATDPAYVLRIAEQYLIRAEARAQIGTDLTGAAADLNAVRTRAGLAATGAATKPDLLLAIEDERRLEFAFEPHRWFDLVRTGRADDIFPGIDPNKYILPIPVTELQTDPALKQNPGY